MPYAKIGVVKNATKEAMISAGIVGSTYFVKVYATAVYEQAVIKVLNNGHEIKSFTSTISPDKIFESGFVIPPGFDESELEIVVTSNEGMVLVRYQPEKDTDREVPAAAVAAKQPREIEQIEELYLNGLH